MSNKELDNLFKSKLETLERKPTASAWDKVQAQTQAKEDTSWPWMRIAAAVTLLFAVGITTWLFVREPASQEIISQQTTPDNEKTKLTDTDSQDEKYVPQIAENKTEEKVKPEPTKQKKIESQRNQNTSAQKQEKGQQIPENQENEKNKPESQTPKEVEEFPFVETTNEENFAANELPDATIEQTPASKKQKADVKGKTLEFDIEQFTKNKEAVAQAETDTGGKSEKGINKVLNLMKDLKSEAGLGNLREAKNEILALNFKKDNNGSK